ncbi:hypothetical protein MVEG_08688 [Podila verticillata NRRL 6337]|nr:hypothetical protein MVEG_08688 [Podila verticillata NRRL 6337]
MRAVSIEGLYLGTREEAHELLGILEFLAYNCPLLTCLWLHITSFNRPASTQVMNKVLQRSLGFIDKSKVVDVDIRWADEEPNSALQTKHLAALENNGVLKVALPTTAIGSISVILELLLTLRRLRVRQERSDKDLALLKVSPVALPNLQELDLAIGRLDATRLAEFLNDKRVQLTSLAFHSVFASWSNPMSLLCDILASCVNPLELEAPLVMTDGFEPHKCPVWATRKLRVLKLGMTRMTCMYENSLYLDVSREESSTSESLGSEARLALQFMEQLGYQTV